MKIDIGNYVVCDLEFTCGKYKSYPREVISIGAYKIHNGKVVDELYKVVKPLTENLTTLTPYCKELTGLTQEEIDNGIEFSEAYYLFKDFVGDNVLTSWSKHDRDVLLKEAEQACIYREDRKFITNHRDIREDISVFLGIVGKNKKNPYVYSLKDGLEMLNIEHEGTLHNALSDAYNTYKIANMVYK